MSMSGVLSETGASPGPPIRDLSGSSVMKFPGHAIAAIRTTYTYGHAYFYIQRRHLHCKELLWFSLSDSELKNLRVTTVFTAATHLFSPSLG